MSSHVSSTPLRRLNPRQAATVDRLLEAGREELDEVGYDQLTVRSVAARAGVSPATAYTHLGSKDHLVAELFWRLVEQTPDSTGRARIPASRVQRTLADFARPIGSTPALATAANRSLLGTDPDVHRVRLKVAGLVHDRLLAALGEPDEDLLDALMLAFFGALLQTGMGFGDYDRLEQRLDRVVAVIMKGRRP